MGHITTASWTQIFIFYYANSSSRMPKRQTEKRTKREKIDVFKFCMRITDWRARKYMNEPQIIAGCVFGDTRYLSSSHFHPSLFFYYSCFCVLNFQSADCIYAWIPPDIVTQKFESFLFLFHQTFLSGEFINKMKYLKLVSFEHNMPGQSELLKKGIIHI